MHLLPKHKFISKIVGTDVLGGPKTEKIYIFSVCCFVIDNRRMYIL